MLVYKVSEAFESTWLFLAVSLLFSPLGSEEEEGVSYYTIPVLLNYDHNLNISLFIYDNWVFLRCVSKPNTSS